MLMWNECIKLLGCTEIDGVFIKLPSIFNELPKIDEGVLGDRKYYSFLKSGVLFLLEHGVVEQISFYVQQDEGFSIYKGKLPVSINSSESKTINFLGIPSFSGGGKVDVLMGYIDRWIKYEKGDYALHLQFNQNDRLSKVTLTR
ncbi:hypothetical protein OMR58_25635 [Erwinia sp. INIA-01]|uniref:hypothetical protein n=1 Tax=Erwinia sp. INIA01 TaxID=2991500 RepID=UPI0022240BC6|nr:hypothetical protein [Erwinia sp. INIA01]MCW1877824.1 hypothetical protein [Erwinia sp. INIA01]